MTISAHCSLLNWIPKLDSNLRVKFKKDDSYKIIRISASKSKCNENEVCEFISFLSKTVENIRNLRCVAAVMKQFPKLGVLQMELLNYPHLLQNPRLQMEFAKLLNAYLNNKSDHPKTAELVKFWCFQNFKKLILIAAVREQEEISSEDSIKLEAIDDEMLENIICNFLRPQNVNNVIRSTLLKILVLFLNTFEYRNKIRFTFLLAAIEKAISQCNLALQRELFTLSSNDCLTFPASLVGEKLFESIIADINSEITMEAKVPRLLLAVKNVRFQEHETLLLVIKSLLFYIQGCKETMKKYLANFTIQRIWFSDDKGANYKLDLSIALEVDEISACAIYTFLAICPFDMPQEEAIHYLHGLASEFLKVAEDNKARHFLLIWAFWIIETQLARPEIFKENYKANLTNILTTDVFLRHERELMNFLKANNISSKESNEDMVDFHLGITEL